MWVCVLICDQCYDQWLIDLMLSDQVRVIRLLALINAASNFPLLYFFFLSLSPPFPSLSPSFRLNYTMRRDRILLNSSFIWMLVSRRSERQWIRLKNYRLVNELEHWFPVPPVKWSSLLPLADCASSASVSNENSLVFWWADVIKVYVCTGKFSFSVRSLLA